MVFVRVIFEMCLAVMAILAVVEKCVVHFVASYHPHVQLALKSRLRSRSACPTPVLSEGTASEAATEARTAVMAVAVFNFAAVTNDRANSDALDTAFLVEMGERDVRELTGDW